MVPPERELSQEDIDALLGMGAGQAGEQGSGSAVSSSEGDKSGAVAKSGEKKVSGVNKDLLDALFDVEMNVKIRFGKNELSLEEILLLGDGSVVELDKNANEPVDILANGSSIAQGEIVVINGKIAIKITHLVSQEERLKALLSNKNS